MFCARCIQTIKDELEILELTVINTRLGQVTIKGSINPATISGCIVLILFGRFSERFPTVATIDSNE